jgi:hypothetical protein
MKLFFVVFLATCTMTILSCNNVIQNGKKIQRFVERHAEISKRNLLKSKLQEMEELKAEIEDLKEQTAYEGLSEPEISDEDYFGDYLNESHENEKDSNIQRQDDEKTTITLVNNTAISNDTRIKNNKLEEDNEGCDGPE